MKILKCKNGHEVLIQSMFAKDVSERQKKPCEVCGETLIIETDFTRSFNPIDKFNITGRGTIFTIPTPEHFNIHNTGLIYTYCKIENDIYYITGVEAQGSDEWGYGKSIGLRVRKIEPEYTVMRVTGNEYVQTPLKLESNIKSSRESWIQAMESYHKFEKKWKEYIEAEAKEQDCNEVAVSLSDIMPCPFCHNPVVQPAMDLEESYGVQCEKCYASGPKSRDKREAIGLWNSIYDSRKNALKASREILEKAEKERNN